MTKRSKIELNRKATISILETVQQVGERSVKLNIEYYIQTNP